MSVRSQRVSHMMRRELVAGLLFILPWIIGFLAFILYPMLASLYYSFTDYPILSSPTWIGLGNFRAMFEDELFYQSIGNTFYMALIGVPLQLLFALICASMLNFKVKGQAIFRTLYYFPSIVPVVASTLLWVWILNPQYGFINQLLQYVGIRGPNWVNDPVWAKPSFILMGIWGIGGTMIIYLAALQDVPKELYEAADLDGANSWNKFMAITFPLISSATLFNLVMGVIGSFQYFTQAYVFSTAQAAAGQVLGSPQGSTLFYALYLYVNGFRYFKMGYASAMAWFLFFVILLCTLGILRGIGRRVYYAGG
jgi:multiple sugar transport system permease protein